MRRVTVALAGFLGLLLALAPQVVNAVPGSTAPPPPRAGQWVTTKKGSNTSGSFRVGSGRHAVTGLHLHGGDAYCGKASVQILGRLKLHAQRGAGGDASTSDWVFGAKVGGSTTGLNPKVVKLLYDGKHHDRGSLKLLFTGAAGGHGSSGSLFFEDSSLYAACDMTFTFKES